ncbi:MAG TPA: RodZ domain-containing protein [Steroidobacteraceae bacterium]|nr:RodZ domain-containing protein [Steroidobacteraceae bacterium]
MTEATAAPGARLRIERERRGLSLQKAADDMHLDAWVVEALEADQYDRVGPAVYAKGHLKKYAAMLAIPGDEVVAAYDALHVITANAPAPTPAVRVHQAPPLVNNLPKGQIAAGLAFLLIFAGVLWWKPWQHRAAVAASGAASSASAPSEAPRSEPSASADSVSTADRARGAEPVAGERPGPNSTTPGYGNAESPAVAAAPAAPGARGVRSAPGTAPSAELGVGHARLRMSFSADSWVEVHDAAGRRIFSGYGRANSVKDLAGEAPLRVYLGYASGVQLEINDHAVAIGRSFVHGDVARFQAGADGVLRTSPAGAQAGGVAAPGAQPHG